MLVFPACWWCRSGDIGDAGMLVQLGNAEVLGNKVIHARRPMVIW